MKLRGLIVAAVVLIALASTLYWSEHRKIKESSPPAADAAPPVLKMDEAAITGIELDKKDLPPLVLAKNPSGTWQITQPQPLPADQSAASGLVSSLASLPSQRLVEDKASDLKPYGLGQPVFEAKITEKNGKLYQLLIGDETPTGNAFYVGLAGDPRIFTIASYNKTGIDKDLNDLRDKRLLTMDADKISRIEINKKSQDIEFGRNKSDWQILKPRPLRADSDEVGDLARKLSDARMELGATDKDDREVASAYGKAAPLATVKVTGPSGSQELQVRKSKDIYYAKSSVVEGAYKIASDLGQALDKGLDDYRNKKIFDFGFDDPTKIELHNGSKAYFLTRSGNHWWSNGKKMDAESVQAVVSKLRDLTASKFVDSGFTTLSVEASVTSDDGKRTEKVSLSKSGAAYLCKRENDPSLYQVESSSIDDLLKAAEELKPAATAAK